MIVFRGGTVVSAGENTGATKTGDTTASVTSAASSILTGLFKKL